MGDYFSAYPCAGPAAWDATTRPAHRGGDDGDWDADAAAYFAASGTSAAPYTTGINAAIVAMKTAGLWDKADRIWMFAGQNEAGSLIDWKALNTDAETVNDPDWGAGVGFTLNGTSQYIDTGFAPSGGAQYVQNSGSFAVDAATSTTGNNCIMGNAGESQDPPITTLTFLSLNMNARVQANSSQIVTAHGGRTALWMASRTSSGATALYKDGVSLATDGDGSVAVGSSNWFVGAQNNGGTPALFTACDARFAFVGAGLDDTEAAALASIRQTLGETIGWL